MYTRRRVVLMTHCSGRIVLTKAFRHLAGWRHGIILIPTNSSLVKIQLTWQALKERQRVFHQTASSLMLCWTSPPDAASQTYTGTHGLVSLLSIQHERKKLPFCLQPDTTFQCNNHLEELFDPEPRMIQLRERYGQSLTILTKSDTLSSAVGTWSSQLTTSPS